jgi:hypothetical protein
MQIVEETPVTAAGSCGRPTFPGEAASDLRGLIEAGTTALKTNLERVVPRARPLELTRGEARPRARAAGNRAQLHPIICLR